MIRIACYCFFFLSLSACHQKTSADERLEISQSTSLTNVRIIRAKKMEFEYGIQVSGRLESFSDVAIQSKKTSLVKSVSVKNGDWTNAGDVLAELENTREEMVRDKALVSLKERLLSFEDLMMPYLSTAHDSTVVTNVSDNLKLSSGVSMAEISYKEAVFDYENTFIRSTSNGRVCDLQVRPGNVINSGDPFCKIYDPNHYVAVCEVLDLDAQRLRIGGRAELRTLDNPSPFSGTIVEINPRIDVRTNLVRLVIAIDKAIDLFPGIILIIDLKVPQRQAILIPKEAIVIKSGRQIAFTASKGFSRWNDLVVGKDNGTYVEILAGVVENDSVIVTNNVQLSDNSPILVKN